jgi:FkbM family methyltransferase
MDAVVARHLSDGPSMEQNGEALLLDAVAPTARVLFDVGANVGAYAARFLERAPAGARAVLFEPSLGALAKLQARFSGLPSVEICDRACGDREGSLPFFEEEGAGETSSLVEGFSISGSRARDVALTTLDVEAERRAVGEIDLVKIDAEGYDGKVLEGARGLLGAQRIGVLQFEYNAPWARAGGTLAAALSLLSGAGYATYLLKRAGLHAFPYATYGEFFGYANFVAVSPARAGLVAGLLRGPI